jgi:predicted transposase YdaD
MPPRERGVWVACGCEARAGLGSSKFKLPIRSVAHAVAGIVREIDQRLEREARPSDSELLRTATFVLLGLKYDKIFVEKIMSQNVLELSSTYQALLQEGRQEGKKEGNLEEAREMLLRFGRRRLGEADEATKAFLESITSVETLESFADRLWDIETWAELQRPQ